MFSCKLHGFSSRFKSVIHFELICVCVWGGVKRVVQFHFLARDYSVFSSPFVEETVLAKAFKE